MIADISHYQGEINWSKVSKEADFAIIRVLEASVGEDNYAKTNIREWRHIFGLRCAKATHPDRKSVV